MSRMVLAAAASALAASAALAPAFAGDVPAVYPGLDVGYFKTVVLPAAKPGAVVTVYADDARFQRLFAETVVPRLAKSHGFQVRFVVKPADVILSEIANARAAGEPSPADLVLVGERTTRRLMDASLVTPFDLRAVLPNGRDLDPRVATVADGAYTGGVAIPFHVARQVVAYDSRSVSAEDLSDLARLANYASVNPGRFGYAGWTGASASFVETAAVGLASPACRSRLYDTEIGSAAAGFAKGDCGQSVAAYFKGLRLHATVARTPAELLLKLSNGSLKVAVTVDSDVAEAALRGAMPASVKVATVPGQVFETVGVMVPKGVKDFAPALVVADDLMSATVQKTKLERFGSASARLSVKAPPAIAAWFAQPVSEDASARARPVSEVADALAARVFGPASDLASR
ncbi:extracellular solute-binding protein [Prosthecomicrobium sp. N25]|uniref:extracellular solute-binding protein n=1 Tax=Prosthecomicrobium sp. N25 TaxID=3129254 RepID=UPI003077C3CA